MNTSRNGMALVIVLVLCTALLSVGLWFISGFRHRTAINPAVFERIQMDFFAQGILQAAMLKFKKMPSEFYYAFRARSIDPAYLDLYLCKNTDSKDLPPLSGTMTLPSGSFVGKPVTVTYSTDFDMVYNQLYNQDGIVIRVNIQTGGRSRQVSHTINVLRHRV